jgi:hypothetical protein
MVTTRAGEVGFSLTGLQICSWLLLAAMTATGWWFFSLPFAKGVLVGGGLANLSFLLLKRDLEGVLAGPLQAVKGRFFIKYYSRLAALCLVLFVLVRYRAVPVVGLLVGLSTILLSIGIMAVPAARRLFIISKEAA